MQLEALVEIVRAALAGGAEECIVIFGQWLGVCDAARAALAAAGIASLQLAVGSAADAYGADAKSIAEHIDALRRFREGASAACNAS